MPRTLLYAAAKFRNHVGSCAGESALIVVQATTSGNEKRFAIPPDWKLSVSSLRMEALPMITPKDFAEGMELLITLALSLVAGLLAFLFVSLVVNVLGLSGG